MRLNPTCARRPFSVRYAFRRIVGVIAVSIGAALGPIASAESRVSTVENELRPHAFDLGWRFFLGDQPGAEAPGFDDAAWRKVDLPHDWSIEDASGSEPARGPHDPATPEGSSTGNLRGGIGWYRIHFTSPTDEAESQLELILNAAQQECDVWVNGIHVGFQPHGYLPLRLEIAQHLKAGAENVVAVRVCNPEMNTRWYSGSGLYRGASLRRHNSLYIPTWGTRLDTVWLKENSAQLQVRVEVINSRSTAEDVELDLELESPTGEKTHHSLGRLRLPPHAHETVNQAVDISSPRVWSPENPQRYRSAVVVLQGKHALDRCETAFGIRTVSVSAEKGLLINGQSVKLKGACLHHDNGLLGASAFPDAEWRRVRLMKAAGFNAIRTSHNPPSSAFLEACDEEGILVIDEFADTWELPKKLNGYQRYFDAHWKSDLDTMLTRDFNHPSIIMWSIGNEIPERFSARGVEIGKQLAACVRSMDTRRPVTNAVNAPWENANLGSTWETNDPAFALLDVCGYNYGWDHYESDHVRHPERVIVGTESYPAQALENWSQVEAHTYAIGDFVWTGMDHIGESGIGHTTYIDEKADPRTTGPVDWGQMPWPFWINWSGDIDLIGNKKPQSLYRDVVWKRSSIEVCVHEPLPVGKKEKVGAWGWPAELPSWNWPGCEGKSFTVSVYSRAERVRLELNGRIVGEKSIDSAKSITASFNVPWERGVLKAIALNQDRVVGERELRTTGPAKTVRMTAEHPSTPASRAALLFLPIEILDANGLVVPDASVALTLRVSGEAELKAFGSANPEDIASVSDASATSFRGHALAILRSTGKPGKVRVEVSGAGVQTAETIVEFTP